MTLTVTFKVKLPFTLYYSFIYPDIIYCIEVWGAASGCYISSLFKLHKRSVRIIESAYYRANTEPLFRNLQLLPFNKVYQYFVLSFMYKCVNDMLPEVFFQMFSKNLDVYQRRTRQYNKLHVPKSNTSAILKSVSHKGVYLWNLIVR